MRVLDAIQPLAQLLFDVLQMEALNATAQGKGRTLSSALLTPRTTLRVQLCMHSNHIRASTGQRKETLDVFLEIRGTAMQLADTSRDRCVSPRGFCLIRCINAIYLTARDDTLLPAKQIPN